MMRLVLSRRQLGVKTRFAQLGARFRGAMPESVQGRLDEWRSADEGWKRNRRMIISSLFGVCYGAGLISLWSCLPEKVKLPPPDDLETGQWLNETVAKFNRDQWYEWDHQVNSPFGWIPGMANPLREHLARQKFWKLFKDFPTGWSILAGQVGKWFHEASQPEFSLPDRTEGDNRFCVTFELSALLEFEYDVTMGWRVRFRPGAKYFLRRLSLEPRCELILYTREAHGDLAPFGDMIKQRSGGILDIEPESNSTLLDYRLYRNSCYFVDGGWSKSLDKLNRDLARLIHVDLSEKEFGPGHRENCLFVENAESLKELTHHILKIIDLNPDDCRTYL